MKPQTRNFKKNLQKHLANTHVRQNVARNTWISIQKRAAAIAEVPQWEEWRERAYQIKKETLNRLPEYLNLFEVNARNNGVTVIRASTAADANKLVEKIARQHAVKKIVKSKSMVTEEIGFNEFMISKGYEVTETDLGEYVVQLAGESPSNIISPILHKSLSDVARLLSEKLGIPYKEDPEYLTAKAREILREKFLTTDMGVSGANFGIAENGVVVLVENEGNGRMCVSVPRIHVVIMGMEKLIPRMEDLDIFLQLLSRSGTGQKLTSYVTLIKGPRKADMLDGPEAVYFIIVDNGRSQFLSDEFLKQALYCIRCSACLNICPVYQNIGGHAYGWVYQGPIGAIISPQFLGFEQAADLPFASSLCGSCTDVCPVKIPLHHLLLYQRKRIVEYKKRASPEKMGFRIYAWMMLRPQRFNWLSRWASRINAFLSFENLVPAWSRQRKLPNIALSSFREWWKKAKGNR